MTTTKKTKTAKTPKLDAAADQAVKEKEEEAKKKVKVLRITDALLTGATGVKTYIERLGANFFLSPRTRKTTKEVLDENPENAVASGNPFAVRLDQVEDEVRACVTGWEDSEDDEEPLRTAAGTIIPFSDENLSMFLDVEEILFVLSKETKELGVISESIEAGN